MVIEENGQSAKSGIPPMKPLNIIDYPMPVNQYYIEEVEKLYLFLHHTAGNDSGKCTVDWWDSNVDRVATAYVIDHSGDVYNTYNEKCWAWHLGLNTRTNTVLNKSSIGIEVCNWGYLVKKADGKYYNYVGGVIPENQVYELPIAWRGFKYFHKYTDDQIVALEQLCKGILQRNPKIQIQQYQFGVNNFEIDNKVLVDCTSGVYFHCNVRTDKTDLYPDQRVIDMLNRLNK